MSMEFALSSINTFNKDVLIVNHIGSIMLVNLGETMINNILALLFGKYQANRSNNELL